MARSKKSVHEMIDTKTENLFPTVSTSPSSVLNDPSAATSLRWGVIVVLVVVLGLVWAGSRGYIIAAMVNGKPIFGWDVASVVMSRYGSQTLTSMVNEHLIADEAMKKGVNVTSADINAKEKDLMKSLGPNVNINDVLQYQGMTRADFDNQVKLQLTVEKILGKDITVSDTEIADYITKNKDTMTATDDAGLNAEAKQAIFSQKLNSKVQTWFAQIKSTAKVTTFLK